MRSIDSEAQCFVTHAWPSISALTFRDVTPDAFIPDKNADLDAESLNSTAKYAPLVSASAQIKDSNGVDVTSSFKIMVYRQNATTTHITNLTEQNNLHDRQVGLTAGNAVRIMDECYMNETFVESYCIPSEDKEAPLQGYSYTCMKQVPHWSGLTGQYLGRRPAFRKRRGRCEQHELCMDGFGSRKIASCVHNEVFDEYTTNKEGQLQGMKLGEVLNVAKMYAVMAGMDENVAVKAKKMGIIAYNSASGSSGGTAQSSNCVNCVDLETDLLEPGFDSLKIEATLLSTGAVAAGGLLFLAMG